jgi:hypothetical protein
MSGLLMRHSASAVENADAGAAKIRADGVG